MRDCVSGTTVEQKASWRNLLVKQQTHTTLDTTTQLCKQTSECLAKEASRENEIHLSQLYHRCLTPMAGPIGICWPPPPFVETRWCTLVMSGIVVKLFKCLSATSFFVFFFICRSSFTTGLRMFNIQSPFSSIDSFSFFCSQQQQENIEKLSLDYFTLILGAFRETGHTLDKYIDKQQ